MVFIVLIEYIDVHSQIEADQPDRVSAEFGRRMSGIIFVMPRLGSSCRMYIFPEANVVQYWSCFDVPVIVVILCEFRST